MKFSWGICLLLVAICILDLHIMLYVYANVSVIEATSNITFTTFTIVRGKSVTHIHLCFDIRMQNFKPLLNEK
jgi:hypothetical protein